MKENSNYTTSRVLARTIWFRNSLREIIGPYTEQIDSLTEVLKAAKVETDDQLAAVTNNVRKLKDIEKAIKAVHKNLNDPLNAAKKDIKKEMDMPLDRISHILTKVNAKITSYNALKLAQSREESKEVKSKGVEDIKDLKASGDDLIYLVQVISRKIFGGRFKNKEGKEREISRPETIEEFNAVIAEINDKFPDTSYFHDDLKEIALNLSTAVIKLAEQVRTAAIVEDFKPILERLYLQALPSLMLDMKVKEVVSKKNLALEKTVKDMTSSKGTGLRTDIEFTIIKEEDVPREFMSVDPKKINAYKAEHRNQILGLLKEGKSEEIIDGIKFSAKQQTLIR